MKFILGIGKMIVEKQQELEWGKSVIGTLSQDLKKEFPSVLPDLIDGLA